MQNILANRRLEQVLVHDVDLVAEDGLKLLLHGQKLGDLVLMVGTRLQKHVHVARVGEVLAEDRTEEGKLPHSVPPTEVGDRLHGNGNADHFPRVCHGPHLLPAL
jgi:hypothetical protein